MNSEAFLFSVVVALIGMATVFTGLTLLSLMMMFLRKLFPTRETPLRGAVPPPLKMSIPFDVRDTRWVVAAVAAYLCDEARASEHSAARWRPTAGDRQDPWVAQPRV